MEISLVPIAHYLPRFARSRPKEGGKEGSKVVLPVNAYA